MKKNLFIMALGIAVMAIGCSKDNEIEIDGIEIPKAVIENFEKQYPEVANVRWMRRSSYIVAQFDLPSVKSDVIRMPANTVWYNDAANCIMEELDIPVSKLPQPVQDAFKASIYANCEVDDIDMISRDGFAKVYVLEVEGRTTDGNEVDINLYFSEDGLLLREMSDTDNDDYDDMISEVNMSKFDSALKEMYGEYSLIEADKEDNGEIEIEIITLVEGKQVKLDVVFGKNGKFIYDVYETAINDAPEEIRKYISEKYADQDIDEVDIARTADKQTFYVFEIEIDENGSEIEKDIILQIDENGTVGEIKKVQ